MQNLWTLSIGYFFAYLATGVAVKFFTGNEQEAFLALTPIEYLVYSTATSSLICIAIALFFGWHRRGALSRNDKWQLLFSGACTAYIVPSTTLIYTLPISIMVAMVMMRGSVIVASRIVDLLLKWQGLQNKHVSWQEEVAVACAVSAVSIKLIITPITSSRFPAVGLILLSMYFFAYLARIYIMNRAKILGVAGKKLDQRLYFAWEQLFASGFLFLMTVACILTSLSSTSHPIIRQFVNAIFDPDPNFAAAGISGFPYAIVAFLSVFLFLFPGKSATFTGVLNRLVSLMGGTASSLLLFFFFSTPFPPSEDWWSLSFILVAIAFLSWGAKDPSKNARSAALCPATQTAE